MAVYREPLKCFNCGEIIEQKHKDQSHIAIEHQLIGDTFIGYEKHECKKPYGFIEKIQQGGDKTV